jgi:hypothetical protein
MTLPRRSVAQPGSASSFSSQLPTTILSRYPTAVAFRGVSVKALARIIYDGSHKIGEDSLAR